MDDKYYSYREYNLNSKSKRYLIILLIRAILQCVMIALLIINISMNLIK